MRRVILAVVGTIAGLTMLLSFKTGATPPVALPPAADTTLGSSTDSTGGSNSTSGGGATSTVTGNAAQTRYGPVQVQITVTNGQLTAARAVVYPTKSTKDAKINASAIPHLNQEAVAAKSARIDMISGATYTSTGYIASLQSALNNAGLA